MLWAYDGNAHVVCYPEHRLVPGHYDGSLEGYRPMTFFGLPPKNDEIRTVVSITTRIFLAGFPAGLDGSRDVLGG